MIYLLIYTLIAFKLTDIIVYEDIFSPIRDRLAGNKLIFALVSCHNCISVWVGFVLSIILLIFAQDTPIGLIVDVPFYVDIVGTGLFTGGAVTLIYKIKNK